MTDVKQAEIAWHDNWYEQNGAREYPPSRDDFQEIFQRVNLTGFADGGWAFWGDARIEMMKLIGDVRGAKVLDYGCGAGQLGIYLALQGAQVSGFDISSKGVAQANAAARQYGLLCNFETMDAEHLQYPDASFDLVIGFGVLHHVIKYSASATHLARVLRAGGRVVFHETLWDNPAINFVRRWTTEDDDAGDAHLTEALIREFGRPFQHTEIRKRHLIYMLKRLGTLPERDLSASVRPRPFWKALRLVDSFLVACGLSRFCGEAIITYSK